MSSSVKIEPAYHIPLGASELNLVGEIAAINGQIEYLLGHVVNLLLGISHEAMLAVMHSSSIKNNTYIFVTVARAKCRDPELLRIAEDVFTRMEALSKGRNDFIHAIYASDAAGTAFTLTAGIARPVVTDTVAVKTGSYKKRSITELQAVRDEAAKISCALAHFERCILLNQPGTAQTPWLGKF
jgi:hypothetical protein